MPCSALQEISRSSSFYLAVIFVVRGLLKTQVFCEISLDISRLRLYNIFVKKGLSNKGFTLVELLIATAIFAFAISGILIMFITCASLDQANRNKSIAVIHAEFVMEDMMEYMRNNEVDSLQKGIEDADKKWWDWNTATINGKGLTALNDESIDTAAPSSADPLDITVTVSWKDRATQTNKRSLILKTLISKR